MLQDLQCFCDLDAFVHIHECLHCWTCVSANQKAVRNWMFVTSVSERTNNENDAKMMHYLNCATMHVHWLMRLQLKIKMQLCAVNWITHNCMQLHTLSNFFCHSALTFVWGSVFACKCRRETWTTVQEWGRNNKSHIVATAKTQTASCEQDQ